MDFSLTKVGKRQVNEDSILIDKKRGIYLLADGLGGHCCGEIASQMAVDIVGKYLRMSDISVDSVIQAFNLANFEIVKQQEIHGNMKTTLVGLFHSKDGLIVANVGDSRCYQVRGDTIIYKTKDHSVSYLLAQAGLITEDEIRFHEDRNKLLQALGTPEGIKVNVEKLNYTSNDIFLLASDGFWEHFSDEMLNEYLVLENDKILYNCERKILLDDMVEQDNYSAIICGGFDE